MVDFKELEEGASVGRYRLEHRIGNDHAGMFFAVLADDGERLLMRLAPESGDEGERQFATWHRSRLLRHPNLLDVRDVGRLEFAGSRYIYGVFETPDEILANAIGGEPLSEPETRGVLEAALAGLRYLHGQGLVHGAVHPGHVVAVGETVKLSTDSLRESDDLELCAEDVRQLGEMVRTLRRGELLTEPLATVVRYTTTAVARQRWTLAEVARAIEPPPVGTVSEQAAVEAPAPISPAPISPDPIPAAPVTPEPAMHYEPRPADPEGLLKWILAGVAIALFAMLLLDSRRKPEIAVLPIPATPPSPAAPATTEPLPAPPPPSTPVKAVAPVPATWRVIAFTYRSRDQANKKARQINDRWPDLHASVFTPGKQRGYYLVALGDRMDRDEATRLQRKARRLGMPRDTFVQNYSE
jgi:hypothetical protein